MGPDPNTEMSLRQKTIEGVFWSGLARGGQHLSRLLATVLLVRLLMPEDFGLMAIAFIFMHFMMILGEMGLKPALIHGQDLNDLHYSSVFWLKVLVGTLLMLLTILAAPLIAGFYNRPDLEQILVVLSLNLVIVPLASVHQALLVKAMDFKTLAKPEIAATTLAGAAAIVAASMGLGIWSLVVQSLTFRGLTLCIVWALSDWRPRLVFSLQSLREVFPFGAYMTAHQLTDYGVRNVDQLLIGKLLGTVDLGFYTLAYKLMILPLQNISGVISGVAFPAFSRIHHDLERGVYRSFCNLRKVS